MDSVIIGERNIIEDCLTHGFFLAIIFSWIEGQMPRQGLEESLWMKGSYLSLVRRLREATNKILLERKQRSRNIRVERKHRLGSGWHVVW